MSNPSTPRSKRLFFAAQAAKLSNPSTPRSSLLKAPLKPPVENIFYETPDQTVPALVCEVYGAPGIKITFEDSDGKKYVIIVGDESVRPSLATKNRNKYVQFNSDIVFDDQRYSSFPINVSNGNYELVSINGVPVENA